MRSRKIRLAVAVTSMAIGAGAVAAPAMGGVAAGTKEGHFNSFKVGDYKVQVNVFGDTTSAEVGKGKQFVDYDGDATKNEPDRIKGDFGNFGKVDMSFHKSGPFKPEKIPNGCTGTPEKQQKGVWKGTFKLKSEKHLVKTTKHELKGSIIKTGNLDCGSQQLPDGINLQSGSNKFLFNAFKPRNKGKAQFFALTGESKNGANILRGSFTRGPRSDFKAASDLNSATVKGPAPFSGTGQFTANPVKRGGTSAQGVLSGNLKGGFLGTDEKVAFHSNDAFLTDGAPIRSKFERRFRGVR